MSCGLEFLQEILRKMENRRTGTVADFDLDALSLGLQSSDAHAALTEQFTTANLLDRTSRELLEQLFNAVRLGANLSVRQLVAKGARLDVKLNKESLLQALLAQPFATRVREGALETAKLLLDLKADVTPDVVELAVTSGAHDVFALFASRVAKLDDLRLRDPVGTICKLDPAGIKLCVSKSGDEQLASKTLMRLLSTATRSQRASIACLIELKADIRFRDDKFPALMRAAYEPVAQQRFPTAADLAVLGDHVEELLKHGAPATLQLAFKSSARVIRLMHEYKADLESTGGEQLYLSLSRCGTIWACFAPELCC